MLIARESWFEQNKQYMARYGQLEDRTGNHNPWCSFEHNYNKLNVSEKPRTLALLYAATKSYFQLALHQEPSPPRYPLPAIAHSRELWKDILSLSHNYKIEEAVDLTTKTLRDGTSSMQKLFVIAERCDYTFVNYDRVMFDPESTSSESDSPLEGPDVEYIKGPSQKAKPAVEASSSSSDHESQWQSLTKQAMIVLAAVGMYHVFTSTMISTAKNTQHLS